MIKIVNVEEAPFKDENQLGFTDWEKVNVEALNGLLISNYYASNEIIDRLPRFILATGGVFPSNVNFGKDFYGLFSRVKFGGNCTVTGGNISLDPGKSVTLNIYPNAEPIVSWDEFNITTNTEAKLSFKMVRFSDSKVVYAERTFDSFEKKINIELGANVSTELKEMVITITNKGTSTILINDIDYKFTVDSRGDNLLSDLNAGLLNGKSEQALLEAFLAKINKDFLSKILGTPSTITADDSKKLGGQTLAQIKNLIPLLQLNNSYDDAKNSDGQYKGSDGIFSIRMPTSIGVGKNVNGNSVTVKGIKFYLHVNLRQVDIAPNQQITSTSISYPTQGGSFVLRPFCVNSTSTPKVTASANTGYSSYTYTLRNNSTSKVTGAFYVFSLIIGFVG